MSDTGAISPGTISIGTGTINWTNPDNAKVSDDVYAVASFTARFQQTKYLIATNFGFSIPAGATINGIKIEREKKTAQNAMVTDVNGGLVKDGSTVVGSNVYTSAGWSSTEAYDSAGGDTSLFGTTWTADEINASTFGIKMAAWNVYNGANTASIDHIRITVYYTGDTGASVTHHLCSLGVGK